MIKTNVPYRALRCFPQGRNELEALTPWNWAWNPHPFRTEIFRAVLYLPFSLASSPFWWLDPLKISQPKRALFSLGTFFLGELSPPVHENNWICGASFRVFPSPQRVSVVTTKNGGVLCCPRNNALKEGPQSIWVLPTFLCMNPNLRPLIYNNIY